MTRQRHLGLRISDCRFAKREIRALLVAFVFLLSAFCLELTAFGQTATATLSGTVEDQNGAIVPGVEITIMNPATALERQVTTNDAGYFTVPLLPPGQYVVTARRSGFAPAEIRNVVLNVGDQKALRIELKAGDVSATVQVVNEAPLINESPAVGTVVDRKYVENMPLNGRSFQDLVLLTPGVVTNSPQRGGTLGNNGEFSVNGQRTESNYYSVDGVSGNVGVVSNILSAGISGSLPAATALGTTQSIVSVDALQEFRVQTSSYSAEYGRNPGGQFSFATRSGGKEWHGSGFEYLRNDVFDANDWFNNTFGKPKAALRQNDFGGTFSGPVLLPRFGEGGSQPGYNGRSRTFFFFSYEGLRLVQPQAASIAFVPTVTLRQSVPQVLQPILNAFPVSNCGTSTPNCSSNLGNGLGQFIGTWSNPSSLNSSSLRLDHTVNKKLNLFFRFQDTPSRRAARLATNASIIETTTYRARSYTVGADSALSGRVSNQLRMDYRSNRTRFFSALPDNFGGAISVDLFQTQTINLTTPTPSVAVVLSFAGFTPSPQVLRRAQVGQQRQSNFNDSVTFSRGVHLLKFGADYRRIFPVISPQSPVLQYVFSNQTALINNAPNQAFGVLNAEARPTYQNFSAFGQDEWRVSRRLGFSIGLRWEVNPPISAPKGHLPYTAQGSSLSTLILMPQGTPQWRTTWYNFAPRVGLSYVLRNSIGHETVVRGGAGVFFDTGQQSAAQGFSGPGFTTNIISAGAHFPLTPSQIPSVIPNPTPPYPQTLAFSPHLQLPYTLQWNASVQQALGSSQSLTVSYVGSKGRRLLNGNKINVAKFNANFLNGQGVVFYGNGATSDYDAMQTAFQRRLTKGLQVLASYTWSHSIDEGSQNLDFPIKRGNSEFDVRHNFSAALSYDIPNHFKNAFARKVLNHWGIDDRFSARSGFPVRLDGNTTIDPITGETLFGQLNLITGQPIYLYGPQYPGGRSINPAAFSPPPAGQAGNAPRNFTRGFGAWQMDLAVRREFPIYERLKLQFRAEAFNIFNHPNFGSINSTYCSGGVGCTFGRATATLASSLGVLTPLYQAGGPRSMQFALKLSF